MLVRRLLDHDATVQSAAIGRVVLLGPVGMHGVSVIAAHKHRLRKRTSIVLGREAERLGQASKHIGQEGRHRTLLGVGAHLLVIEAAENRDAAGIFSRKKCQERGIGAHKVVELRR